MIALKQAVRGLELAGMGFSRSNELEATVHIYGAMGAKGVLAEKGIPLLLLLGGHPKWVRYGDDTVCWLPILEGFVVIVQRGMGLCGLHHYYFHYGRDIASHSKLAFQQIAREMLENRRAELTSELTSLETEDAKIDTIFA